MCLFTFLLCFLPGQFYSKLVFPLKRVTFLMPELGFLELDTSDIWVV